MPAPELDGSELEDPVDGEPPAQADPDPASVLPPGAVGSVEVVVEVVVVVVVDVVSVLVGVVVDVVSVLSPVVVEDGVVLVGAVVSELVAGQPVVAVPVAGAVAAAGVVEPASTVESVWVWVRPASTIGVVLVFVESFVATVVPFLAVVLAVCLCAVAFFAAGLWR